MTGQLNGSKPSSSLCRKVESAVRVCPRKTLTRPTPFGPMVRSNLPMRVHRRPGRMFRIAKIWRREINLPNQPNLRC
ncbi:hypothetical protein SAMN04488696_2781 [Methanolobus profundi]|uniref:Uncharacterized protein n=1 Tax=Methanolobus profundi TaxID=487685 RepID=A0A1I4ULQ9_9EURY|nr:hypothetical protein SAMN04488696_2781 [Methanolobus profundi]